MCVVRYVCAWRAYECVIKVCRATIKISSLCLWGSHSSRIGWRNKSYLSHNWNHDEWWPNTERYVANFFSVYSSTGYYCLFSNNNNFRRVFAKISAIKGVLNHSFFRQRDWYRNLIFAIDKEGRAHRLLRNSVGIATATHSNRPWIKFRKVWATKKKKN